MKRITRKGNYVSLGPWKDDNSIEHKQIGDKVILTPMGRRSFVMVFFCGGRENYDNRGQRCRGECVPMGVGNGSVWHKGC